MSVIPLPRKLSDRPKAHGKSSDVLGTVNIPCGYRLNQNNQTQRYVNFGYSNDSPSVRHGKSVSGKEREKDQHRIAIIPVYPNIKHQDDIAKEEKDYKHLLHNHDFEQRTKKRIMKHNISHLVDEGMAVYEEGIAARRKKLRNLILAEDEALSREIIDQAQRGADWRIDDMKKQTEDLQRRLEHQRLAVVAEKRMQQYMAENPEVRDKYARKTTLETKYSNLVQIAENEAKRQAEREIDDVWYELMVKEVEAKKAREIEDETRRVEAGRDVVTTLEKQIASKLALSEEIKRVKEEERESLRELWNSAKEEELLILQRERKKREKVKKDLEEQLLVAKRRLAERARQEAEVERMFRNLTEVELAREKAAIKEATSRLRGEIVAYMRSLEKLREEEARRNAEVEAIIEASATEVEAKRDLERKKTKEERERILRQVLEGREQQLRAKRATVEEENKRVEVEGELLRKESEVVAALTTEAESRRRENALRYGQELKAQQKHIETMRRRENEENERIRRLILEREREYQKFTEQVVNAPEIITPHAFKILLKESAGRRDD